MSYLALGEGEGSVGLKGVQRAERGFDGKPASWPVVSWRGRSESHGDAVKVRKWTETRTLPAPIGRGKW